MPYFARVNYTTNIVEQVVEAINAESVLPMHPNYQIIETHPFARNGILYADGSHDDEDNPLGAILETDYKLRQPAMPGMIYNREHGLFCEKQPSAEHVLNLRTGLWELNP